MRLNVGGNILEYDENNSTETLVLEATKILASSVISTPGAIFGCFDISHMYLNTKLISPNYMKIHVSMIPQEVM